MFNGIFGQFLDQTVENPPKLWAVQTEKPNSNRKIRPLIFILCSHHPNRRIHTHKTMKGYYSSSHSSRLLTKAILFWISFNCCADNLWLLAILFLPLLNPFNYSWRPRRLGSKSSSQSSFLVWQTNPAVQGQWSSKGRNSRLQIR